jgi:CDP-glucose 4,6-dehydratase
MTIRDALGSFSGRRVLVTGHTGFKGSWLAFLLKQLGADVMGCALPQEPGLSHFALLDLQAYIRHVIVDIRDAPALSAAMQSFRPECVFHLAAQALVRKSYDDPVTTFGSNVMGFVHLLEAVRQCDSVRSLVCITSDKCYENQEWAWGYRENDTLGGHDPYSASKAAAEIAFSAYQRSYFHARPGLGAATARAGNVIGGGDWAPDRVVPDCVRAATRNRRVQLRNPHATRPWQHVLEPLSGYLQLGAQLIDNPDSFSGSWNFGPSSSDVRTVEDVANAISSGLGVEHAEIAASPRAPHEATLLQLNCDKAHLLLGWQPRWGVDKALSATAEWYKAVAGGRDAQIVTRGQIRDYFTELQ